MTGKEEINKYKSVEYFRGTTWYKGSDLNPGETHSMETEMSASGGQEWRVIEKTEPLTLKANSFTGNTRFYLNFFSFSKRLHSFTSFKTTDLAKAYILQIRALKPRS